MPSPVGPKTTTCRRYGQFLDVGDLRTRAVDDFGREILAAIAKRQCNLGTCLSRHLPDGKNTGHTRYSRADRLEELGLVTIIQRTEGSQFTTYTLTPAGWREIGITPPLHLEATQ